MRNETPSPFKQKLPGRVIALFASYIVIALVLSYLVDVMNLFGIADRMTNPGYQLPLLWFQIWGDKSLTEMLQWLLLGSALVLASFYAGLHHSSGSRLTWVWLLLSLGIMFMLVEDAGDFRHRVTYFSAMLFFNQNPYSLEWKAGLVRSFIEVGIYAALGIIMVTSLVKILKAAEEHARAKMFLVTAYIFYAVAAFNSATRNIGAWYSTVGNRALELISGRVMFERAGETYVYKPLGFWFMDCVVEESLELMGAAFLVAALLTFIVYRKKPV